MFKTGDRVRVIHMGRYRVGVVDRLNTSNGTYVINLTPTPYSVLRREESLIPIADNEYVCEQCGHIIDRNYGDDNYTLCEDCRNSGRYVVCEDCGRLIDKIWDNYHKDDYNHYVCEDCWRHSDWYMCDGCNRLIHGEPSMSDGYTNLCSECWNLDDTWQRCENCGDLFNTNNEGDTHNECWYCSACYESLSYGIEDYDYKPYPRFYGQGDLFLGVELEVDNGGEKGSNAEQFQYVTGDAMYYKHDGSLDDGIECVTHPMTLHYHRFEFPWESLCETAVELGYKSHDTSTCGLHVHVSRSALGDTQDEQDATIARILYFFERNWDWLLKFSRRTEGQLNRWAARYVHRDTVEEYHKDVKNCNRNRYMCVNLQNEDTVEFRMFRGTLKVNTILATLELVERICVLCRDCNADEIQDLSWEHFLSLIDPNEYDELITYLKERGIYCKETTEKIGEEI